jgi:hypothetical protein
MGEIAARNMTGEDVEVDTHPDAGLRVNDKGEVDTPYWEYE